MKKFEINLSALDKTSILKDKEPYASILKYLRENPGSRIPCVATATNATRSATRGRLYRLAADDFVRIERFLEVPFFFAV